MAVDGVDDLTSILRQIGEGDRAAVERLLPMVYDQLHVIASRLFKGQPADHTLQPTALVHEAYLKLLGADPADHAKRIKDRNHFFAIAAMAMRQILVNHARDQRAEKRGGLAGRRVTLSDLASPGGVRELDILDVNDQLLQLAEVDIRQARVAELRLFAGMSSADIGDALNISKRTAELDWKLAKSWLLSRLAAKTSLPE